MKFSMHFFVYLDRGRLRLEGDGKTKGRQESIGRIYHKTLKETVEEEGR